MLDDWPAWALFALFFAGAMVRGGFTHVLGRGLRTADQKRTGWLSGPRIARAEMIVSRWGAPAVSLAFLTVGVQTAVLAASGVLRMPWRRFLPALMVGALIWAGVYTTVGMAVISAFWGQTSTRWVVAAALLLALVWGLTSWARSRVVPTSDPSPASADDASEVQPQPDCGRQ